jgi:NRPS condensation-like uncharacterized protein
VVKSGGSMEKQQIPKKIPATASDQIMFLDRGTGDGQSRLVITFNGRLDEARLGKAVRLSLDAEPVLGCRFVERPWRPHWLRLSDTGLVFGLYAVDPRDLELELSDFLIAPLDPLVGPQLRVGLFRSDKDVLCIKMSHTVADGGASMEYARLLGDIYRRLKEDPHYRPSPNLSGSRSALQTLRPVGLKTLLIACARFSVPRPAWGLSYNGHDNSGRSFMVRRIGVERYDLIKNYAKQHKVTIGEIFLTAYYRGLFEALDPPENEPLPVVVPANLRRYLPSGRAGGICNLSGGFFPAIMRKKGEPFEDTLAKVHSSMEREKAKRTEVAQMLFMELAALPGYAFLGAMKKTINSFMMHPGFSNMGIIDPAMADFGDVEAIDAYGMGPVPYPPHFGLGVMTFKGGMILTAGYCYTSTDTGLVSRIFDLLLEEIPRAHAGSGDAEKEMPAISGTSPASRQIPETPGTCPDL